MTEYPIILYKPPQPSKRSTGLALGSLLMIHLLFSNIVGRIYLSAIVPLLPPMSVTGIIMTGNLCVVVPTTALTLILAKLLFKIDIKEMLSPQKQHMKTGLRHFPISLVFIVAASLIAKFAAEEINKLMATVSEAPAVIPGYTDFSVRQPTMLTIAIQAVYVILIGPICEEIMYRGIVMHTLSPYGETTAVLLSAFFFGFMHENVQQAITAMAGGFIYGIVAYRSKSLVPTIIMHMLNNLYGSLGDLGTAMGLSKITLATIAMVLMTVLVMIGLRSIYKYHQKPLDTRTEDAEHAALDILKIGIQPLVLVYIVIVLVTGYLPNLIPT